MHSLWQLAEVAEAHKVAPPAGALHQRVVQVLDQLAEGAEAHKGDLPAAVLHPVVVGLYHYEQHELLQGVTPAQGETVVAGYYH